jgi:hypothetical protein
MQSLTPRAVGRKGEGEGGGGGGGGGKEEKGGGGGGGADNFVTADVLLPLLVFLITRSSLANPFFIVSMIHAFLSLDPLSLSSFFYQYPGPPERRPREGVRTLSWLLLPFLGGEKGYYLTTFESAVTFLKGTTPERLGKSIESEEVERAALEKEKRRR